MSREGKWETEPEERERREKKGDRETGKIQMCKGIERTGAVKKRTRQMQRLRERERESK